MLLLEQVIFQTTTQSYPPRLVAAARLDQMARQAVDFSLRQVALIYLAWGCSREAADHNQVVALVAARPAVTPPVAAARH